MSAPQESAVHPAATPPARSGAMRDLGNALTHSLELVLAMGIGVGLGWKAQQHWPGIAPWGLIGGSLLGAGAVFRSMWRIIAQPAERDAAGAEDGHV